VAYIGFQFRGGQSCIRIFGEGRQEAHYVVL